MMLALMKSLSKGIIKYNNLDTLKNYESKLTIYINEFFVIE